MSHAPLITIAVLNADGIPEAVSADNPIPTQAGN